MNEAVDERESTCLFGVKVHLSYGGVVHSEVGLKEICNEDIDRACFLTHAVKEELEDMKENLVLTLRPEQRVP